MQSHADQARLIHRTTIALNQLHRILQQATDILANLHSLYLVHTRQVDPHFHRPFPALPPAPLTAVPIPSPTSSCDSAPAAPIKNAPPQRPPSQASSTSTSSPPLPQPKRKREPPPPLNEDADWDAWDGDAEVRLVELKKPMPGCDRTGITLLVEWASQLNSAKHVGKNFKKHNANTKQSSYHPHPRPLHPPTHHQLLLSRHLPLQQHFHHRRHLQPRTSPTHLQHLHHLRRLPQPRPMLCQQPSVKTVIQNQQQLTLVATLYSFRLTQFSPARL